MPLVEDDATVAALAETARQLFDLALLDLDLPGVDGLRLAELLRDQGFKRPLIVLTAHVPMPTLNLPDVSNSCANPLPVPCWLR